MDEETDIPTMPSYKFGELFDRMSVFIDFKGCTTATMIERKMKYEINKARAMSKTSAIAWRRKTLGLKAERLDTLIEHGFPERTIIEAIRDPRGLISQTLRHGRIEARRIVLAQRRAAARARFIPIAPRPKVPKRRWWRRE